MQFLALQKLEATIAREPDLVRVHRLYQQYEQTTTYYTTYAYTAAYLEIDSMTDNDAASTSVSKDPGPTTPEQAAKLREEMNKALLTFIDHLQSFDRYKAITAYKYFVHAYLNELLKTYPRYYKNASIYPVLETTDDKFCKVMFEPDEEQVQQTPQQVQSPNDIEQGEEFIHKLKKLEDFGDFSKKVIKSLMAMFAQLQLCHENLAKLARHMVELSKTLEPAQFTYIMKHSLRPLVQLSIPPLLCSPAKLKFNKICLTYKDKRRKGSKPDVTQTIPSQPFQSTHQACNMGTCCNNPYCIQKTHI